MRTALAILLGVAAVVGMVFAVWPKRSGGPEVQPGPRLAWVFEAPRPGSVIANPCVTRDAIYLSAAHARGFQRTGAVYALDPTTGKQRWMFDRNGAMLPTASTPLVDEGRLIVGEGMHGNFSCRLYCLDPASGASRWEFEATDHIEGAPATAGNAVVFPAGNDGLYAVNADTGKQKWNFRADLHIDSSPYVTGGRVFIGSGRSRRFSSFQVVCLDAESGQPVWRTPVNLPAWGSPTVVGDRVFIGLGNARLNESARGPEVPAGALACLDARSGKLLWTFSTRDAVFGLPVVASDCVIFGSRDGFVYGVSLDGRERYRVPMAGPVVAGVAISGEITCAVSVPGTVVCFESATGREVWRHELARPGSRPSVFASPVVDGGRLYIAAEMASGDSTIITLFCFDLSASEGRR